MSKPTSAELKAALLNSLIEKVQDPECPGPVLSAAIQFLKLFPAEEMEDVKAHEISKTLSRYADKMPFAN